MRAKLPLDSLEEVRIHAELDASRHNPHEPGQRAFVLNWSTPAWFVFWNPRGGMRSPPIPPPTHVNSLPLNRLPNAGEGHCRARQRI